MDLFGNCISAPLADNDNRHDYSRLGRYAEFLVCADITKNGYHAIHSDTSGFDVLMIAGHKTYRIQVKSSSIIRRQRAEWRCRISVDRRGGNASRKREVDRRDADILALFHNDLETIVYLPVLPGCGHVKLPVRYLKEAKTIETLQSAISVMDGTPVHYIPEGIPA
ncbi:hypothetical protein L614_002000000400 [Ochrobactrum sp. J50]|nr:hypothetical protein L614_002000000400 [Ochrobactrum sp. J50]